jgi:hypothetical protein
MEELMFHLTFVKNGIEHTVLIYPGFVPKHIPFTMIAILDWITVDTGNGGNRDWLFEQMDLFGDLVKIEKV